MCACACVYIRIIIYVYILLRSHSLTHSHSCAKRSEHQEIEKLGKLYYTKEICGNRNTSSSLKRVCTAREPELSRLQGIGRQTSVVERTLRDSSRRPRSRSGSPAISHGRNNIYAFYIHTN